MTVLQNQGSLGSGYIFIAPQAIGGGQVSLVGPEILDNLGRPVWYHPTGGALTTDFRVQLYQGAPVLTWWQVGTVDDPKAPGSTEYLADTSYRIVAQFHAGNDRVTDLHELLLTPQGTALITVSSTVSADLTSIGGPADGTVQENGVQEIDVATGNVLFEWMSLPDVSVDESYAKLPRVGAAYDYFHINSVNVDTDGNLIVSARHTWTVYKINRTTGAIMWRLGGKKSDFTLGSGLPFAWQHNAVPIDAQTIRIFDNESNGTPVLPYSRVLWVHHDDSTMTAEIVKSIVHPELVRADAEGNAQDLENGNTMIGWGTGNRFSEFDANGQILYDAAQPDHYATYRAYRLPWMGTPATDPMAAAWLNEDGSLAVHAIWNGATEVANWEVYGGASTAAMQLVATAPWNSLDTTIALQSPMADLKVVAKDANGNVIGTSSVVSGPFDPVFGGQPESVTVATGTTVAFSAPVNGISPNYQWMYNGNPISNGKVSGATVSGAVGPTLVIAGVTTANAGNYQCVTSGFGTTLTSHEATLNVVSTADAGRLVNLSCRAEETTGDGALIVGCVVGGAGTSGTMPLLIRAAGPALGQFGLSDVLADPKLTLHSLTDILDSNSGWAGDSTIAETASRVGAFAWDDTASADSALTENLSSGSYTAVISGASGSTGVTLGEFYDASPAGPRDWTTPRLINASGRANVGTGDNLLIAGFVIGGSTAKTVLIRASGPALSQMGISNPLADPKLRLYRQKNGSTLIRTNTGWNADAAIAAAAQTVGAFSWGQTATADCAMLVTLPPGAYSATVSGASGDTGIALVEVYEVP